MNEDCALEQYTEEVVEENASTPHEENMKDDKVALITSTGAPSPLEAEESTEPKVTSPHLTWDALILNKP